MSWSETMAKVLPCGHTEAQHMYADAGELVFECNGRIAQKEERSGPNAEAAGSSPATSTISAVEGSPLDHACPVSLCGKPQGIPCGVFGKRKGSEFDAPHFHLERVKLTRKSL